MKLYTFLAVIELVKFSINSMIILPDEDDASTTVAVDIINECFGSPDIRFGLLFAEIESNEILRQIHSESKAFRLIVSRGHRNIDTGNASTSDNDATDYDYKPRGSITSAVVIATDNERKLRSTLDFLKKELQGSWRTRSRFLIIFPKNICEAKQLNNVFKTLWDYWILNVVLLCSTTRNQVDGNPSHAEDLYTFNPYSKDHPEQWKIIVHETVKVKHQMGSFDHSWYMMKRPYRKITSSEECHDVFFDKTNNLEGYLIPINMIELPSQLIIDQNVLGLGQWKGPDGLVLNTLAKKLNFDAIEVPLPEDPDVYGVRYENGSYSGSLRDVFVGRSHLAGSMRYMNFFPGLEMTYPHDRSGVCFVTRILGYYPAWMNIFAAVYIWLTFGAHLIAFTVIFYVRGNRHDLCKAFLDAERLILGHSFDDGSTNTKYRIFMSFSFLTMIVVSSIFSGGLKSLLTVARAYPNIDSVEQLKEQKARIYGFPNFKEDFDDPDLRANYHDSFKTECLKNLETDLGSRPRACLVDCLTTPLIVSNSTKIHSASAIIKFYFTVYLTTLHWPMKDRYELETQRLVESGHIKKWRYDVYWDSEIKSWGRKRTMKLRGTKRLSRHDLLPPFIILLIGILVAMVAFVSEIRERNRTAIHDAME